MLCHYAMMFILGPQTCRVQYVSKVLLHWKDARRIKPGIQHGGSSGIHLFAGHWLVYIVLVGDWSTLVYIIWQSLIGY